MPNDAWGVGASLLRREDERHLHGRGEFVSDIKLPGTMEVAFVRSPHAHARIRRIAAPPEGKDRVFTAADLPQIKPIRVVTQTAGAKSPAWPPLATDKARYVGEAIAACIAATRGRGRRPRSIGCRRLRGARRRGRPVARHARQPFPGPRAVGRQPLPRAQPRRRRHRGRRARGRSHGNAPIPDEPAVGYAARRAGGPCLPRPPARRGRGLGLDAGAAHDAGRDRRDFSASTNGRSGSSPPMSAAGSGPRRGFIPRKLSWRHWR